MTKEEWGSIAAIVSVIILIAGTLWTMSTYLYRRMQLKAPFVVYYEPSKDNIKYCESVPVSAKGGYLQITLKMRTEVYTEFLSLEFKGSGTRPEISGLYDWGTGALPSGVGTHHDREGIWYWEYEKPHRRPKNSRIKLGVRFKAVGPFQGYLVVGLTAPGASRNKSLPLSVIAPTTPS